ncbi:MAG: hypothetical protein ACRD0S_10175 [Acidimicrobiales bacterium]
MDVLVVCLGNICRSPMAAAFLAARLEELGVDAHVHSAGLLSSGRRVPEHGVAVMAARGFDTSAHRSRRLSAELVDPADLIVAMARDQVDEIAVAHPEARARAFTLKELVRTGERLGARRPGESMSGYVAQLHTGTSAGDDDIDDPIGGPRSVYEATAAEVEDLTARLARLLAGAGG